MNWYARRLTRRYKERHEQGLKHGWQDCARLLMLRGKLTAGEFAAILRATDKIVSPETPKRKKHRPDVVDYL